MFSGIVEEIGRIASISDSADGRRVKISAKIVTSDLKIGDSISCSGTCLTATSFNSDSFCVDATHETLRRCKLGSMKVGERVNLERALRFSDRLGGHLVSGHVDALAHVSAIKKEGFSSVIEFATPKSLEAYFIEKGSVAIDGISLTVAALLGSSSDKFVFSIAAIPHTLEVTTLGDLAVADAVNIEADLIGKYVARWMTTGNSQIINKEGLTKSFLSEHGYT